MKVLQVVVYGAALTLLVGCKALGLGSKTVDYRSGAAQAPSLEVPPDLTAPGNDERYRIPQANGERVATYSDYTKGGTGNQGSAPGSVLPEMKNVTLERDGTHRWLTVKDKPENVWPTVKAFFQDSGLPIKSEDQAAGLIETDWVENIPDIERGVVGKILNKVFASDQRDRYSARLERGKDGVSTEVYITHRGMEETLLSDQVTVKWQTRPNDPEMEAAILQRLMVRLGGGEVAANSTVASSNTSGTSSGSGTASLQEVFGSQIILVNDAFDKSWRRVGLAIERAGWVVEDKDREKGIYFLKAAEPTTGWMDKLMFWKSNDTTASRFRVMVRGGSASSEVSVINQDGVSNEATRQMLEVLYKNFDQVQAAGTTRTVTAPAVTMQQTGASGTATLQKIFDGSNVIVMNDTFDKSWSRVGNAIGRAGLVVDTNDKAKGIYFLRQEIADSSWMEKIKFWKDNDNVGTRYRVNIKDGGKACEVSVTDQDGASGVTTENMIQAIYKNIQ